MAALWWPATATLAGTALAVLAFNLLLVAPRGSLAVSRWQDGLLLALMATTLALVAGLIVRLRRQARPGPAAPGPRRAAAQPGRGAACVPTSP